MIEIKLENIVNNVNVFNDLAKKEMPAKSAFRVAHIIDAITKEFNSFQETRDNLIRKYGNKDENGNLIINENGNVNIPDESIAIFNKELNDLLQEIIEINQPKIPLSALENAKFTPAQMYSLKDLIEE